MSTSCSERSISVVDDESVTIVIRGISRNLVTGSLLHALKDVLTEKSIRHAIMIVDVPLYDYYPTKVGFGSGFVVFKNKNTALSFLHLVNVDKVLNFLMDTNFGSVMAELTKGQSSLDNQLQFSRNSLSNERDSVGRFMYEDFYRCKILPEGLDSSSTKDLELLPTSSSVSRNRLCKKRSLSFQAMVLLPVDCHAFIEMFTDISLEEALRLTLFSQLQISPVSIHRPRKNAIFLTFSSHADKLRFLQLSCLCFSFQSIVWAVFPIREAFADPE